MFCHPAEVELPAIPELGRGFSVLFAGNVGTAQAVDVIVEAAALLRDRTDIRFVVLGQGSRLEWMRAQVAERKLDNLHLAGHFPVETMPGLMRQAGALLVTLADQPIFALTVPSKVQAYLAVGKPIVACLNGEGARLVQEADAGVAAPAGNAQALADAVVQLAGLPPTERERLGANGQRYFKEHFDHETLVDELIRHFGEVAISRGKV
jgi:glycosyltransferase involved in cell wall biosynthesis